MLFALTSIERIDQADAASVPPLGSCQEVHDVLLHGHRGSPAESGIAPCYIAVAVCDLAVPILNCVKPTIVLIINNRRELINKAYI